MKLVVTIDAEEDNWGDFHPTHYSVDNIERVPELQRMFDRYGIRPTYLVDYPVASNPRSVSILKSVSDKGTCEVGVHCHSWNTPPFEEVSNDQNSMLCNLPADLQFRKLQRLTEIVAANFCIRPVSFRAGRWGLGREMVVFLDKLGYKVDTSITPLTNWTDQHGPDFSGILLEPYTFDPEDIFKPFSGGRMLEVPASIGFIQTNLQAANTLFEFLRRRPAKWFRIIGLLHKVRLLNKVWLSPELSSSREMIALTERMIRRGTPLANLFFHSPSLQPGKTPYVRTEADRIRFMSTLEEYLAYTNKMGMEPILLSQALKAVP
jgi:hypothetical protein